MRKTLKQRLSELGFEPSSRSNQYKNLDKRQSISKCTVRGESEWSLYGYDGYRLNRLNTFETLTDAVTWLEYQKSKNDDNSNI